MGAVLLARSHCAVLVGAVLLARSHCAVLVRERFSWVRCGLVGAALVGAVLVGERFSWVRCGLVGAALVGAVLMGERFSWVRPSLRGLADRPLGYSLSDGGEHPGVSQFWIARSCR